MLEMKIAMAVLLGQFDIAHVGTAHGSPPQERLPFAMVPLGWLMRLKEREVGVRGKAVWIELFKRLLRRVASQGGRYSRCLNWLRSSDSCRSRPRVALTVAGTKPSSAHPAAQRNQLQVWRVRQSYGVVGHLLLHDLADECRLLEVPNSRSRCGL